MFASRPAVEPASGFRQNCHSHAQLKRPTRLISREKSESACCRTMSEPDTKLKNWCRRLIEACVEDPRETGSAAAKGNGKLATHRPPPQSPAGPVGERAGQSDAAEPREHSPTRELVELIDAVKEPAATGGGDKTPSGVGEPLVPQALPPAMKTNIFRVTRQQFSELYGVDAALATVENGTVSRCELVAMYMRSFRNVLNYDLLEFREHETYFSRFVGYCTYVLHDLVEALFPEKTHDKIEQTLIGELRAATEINGTPRKPTSS